MASCTCENWTLKDLASALQNMHRDRKKIAVPMFQRGKRWNKEQQKTFIDSLLRGYPVGTMLFYETFEDGQQTYILVDGLQRGNSIKMYINNPTEFFYDNSISDEFCRKVLETVNADITEENCKTVREILSSFIKAQKTFANLQFFTPAKDVVDSFHADYSCIGTLIDVIKVFFDERQAAYDSIASTVIPVIVYHGAEENLPEIFDRINSKGTPLDQYEVYAAAWPVNRRFCVENIDVVEAAIKKYDSFISDGFIIHGYDREAMRSTKSVNAFEYLFGLSKYLVGKYEILGFSKNLADDTVNPLGFELVNACLNETDRIRTLYEGIYGIENINSFEKALCSAIEFVDASLSAITRFKGNSRSENAKQFHSKYQILSMISTTFKEMYMDGDYSTVSPEWNAKKSILVQNLRLYYVYDIITNYWSEGGNSKIFGAAKPNRYLQPISPRTWRIALDSFFEKSMFRTESKQIANPKSEEYVFLNCIYLNTFTAMDQLSLDKFDVEHIAPKEQMKKLIQKTGGSGLPISCVANLCYLPEYVNRSKRDHNFYQDTKYLEHVQLEVVEQKYSFTVREDLEWMDMPYVSAEDFEALKTFYTDYCVARFETMKKLFCTSMGIDYDAFRAQQEEVIYEPTVPSTGESSASSTRAYSQLCVRRVEAAAGLLLEKVSQSIYKTPDSKKGFIFCSSKAYRQGQREKYWYGYRKNPISAISGCEEKYMVYGCKDADEILVIPVETMEALTSRMNYSAEEDGTVSHWHVVFFRNLDGHMTQLLSNPELEEIDVDSYKLAH